MTYLFRRQSRLCLVAALAATACNDASLPTATSEPVAVSYLAAGQGAAGAAAGFHWLQPLARPGGFSGMFDGSLEPIVEICRPLGSGCAMPAVARFTMQGNGPAVIRVDQGEQHYIVNWNTAQHTLIPAQTYRIRARVGGTQLGHVDVRLVANASEAKLVDESRYLPVVFGRTLPIRFRIEQGAVPPPGPPLFTGNTGAAVSARIDEAGGTLTASFDGVRYTLAIPAGALLDPVTITMMPLEGAANFPLEGGLAAGVRFAPDGLTFYSPAALTIELAPGTSGDDPIAFGFDGSGSAFHLTPSSVTGSTAVIPVLHFSGNGVAGASPAQLAAALAIGPIQSANQAQGALAVLERAARNAGSYTQAQLAEAARILGEWYDNVVHPALTAAANSDAALEAGLREYMTWQIAAQRFSVDLSAREQQAIGLARIALQAGIDRADAECRSTNDMDALARALRWVAAAQQLGLEVTGPRCIAVSIESVSFPQTPVPGEATTLQVVARVVNADGAALDSWRSRVRVTPAGATDNSARSGITDENGAFSVTVTPADGVREIRLTINACVDSTDRRLSLICATALVVRSLEVVVQVQPANASLSTNATLQYSATVTGTRNTAVTWSATGGTISSTGLYTAGTVAGSYVVVATSVADPSKSHSVAVTVRPADVGGTFNGRVVETYYDLADGETSTYNYRARLVLLNATQGELTYYRDRTNGWGETQSYWYVHSFRDGAITGITVCNNYSGYGFCAGPNPPRTTEPQAIAVTVSGSTATTQMTAQGSDWRRVYVFTGSR